MANETLSSYSSPLYWMVLLISAVVVAVILGPGLYSNVSISEWYMSWQKQMFHMLCHQQLDRTIHLGEVPMAVCSRCTGIYIMFFANMLIVPLLPQTKWRNKWAIFLVFIALSFNLVDFSVNAFDVWENTLTSRFLVGSLIGISAAHLLGTEQPQQPKKRFNHGTK